MSPLRVTGQICILFLVISSAVGEKGGDLTKKVDRKGSDYYDDYGEDYYADVKADRDGSGYGGYNGNQEHRTVRK